MIESKKDYLYYLKCDRIALGKKKFTLMEYFMELCNRNHIWRFQRLLRKCEYYKNVVSKKSIFGSMLYFIYKVKFKNLSLKLNFSIPENVFGPGLAIMHYGTIVVNPRSSIGSNCRIHVCTNIGESGGVEGAPIIGNNVYIGPGAKIYGAISIADNSVIAANAAVNKTVKEEGMLIGGIPAKVLKSIDVKRMIKHI
ncbi:serine O-acetyltransferase [Rhodonellum sp.]|uniref:serine O-acetyltransferase n=1 Tax=Rhodonellum sp. TaxID=2231180 RepID=UPI002716B949|nr:serine acetyltransferase [Rhodonellum sp.]MDO9551552.1 serine acetyltransferase [Rhodonellum sp.]